MTEDITFVRRGVHRPAPVVQAPLLQWSIGLNTVDRRVFVGWFVEYGKDEQLDAAMEKAGFQTGKIKHGSGNIVEHWLIEVANLFILADGVQSIGEMKAATERYGIAFWWQTTEDGRPQSELKVQVLMRELLEVGYTEPLILTVKSTLTGDVLSALTRQYDVLDAIDALRAQQGKEALNPPFYACSLQIGPGEEVARGKVQSKMLTPPIAFVPEVITREYLVDQYIKKEWLPLIEKRVEQAVRWSTELSAKAGIEAEEPQQAEPATDDETKVATVRQRIKAITGAEGLNALKLWMGDERMSRPNTLQEWEALANRCEFTARERQRQQAA